MTTRRVLLLPSLLILVPLPAAARRRAVRVPETFPLCSMVTGTAAVTFTLDEGRTLAPSAQPLEPIAYTIAFSRRDPRVMYFGLEKVE